MGLSDISSELCVLSSRTPSITTEGPHSFLLFFRWNLGKTYNIVLGSGQVVLGMDMGLREMCVGEKRTVIIPPHLGYGEAGVGKRWCSGLLGNSLSKLWAFGAVIRAIDVASMLTLQSW